MIHSLSYEVTFPSTGKSLSNSLTFSSGMTAIVGPNGSGKTLIVEMIRFALYGSKALRGQADDYRGLKVELVWDDYKVFRNGSKALLSKEGIELAVGTTSVNAKILEIMGFDLKVFDVACSINQDEIAALSMMTPSERKRMVDSVSGVDALIDLAKWASEQAKDEAIRAEALTSTLVTPVAPNQPEPYTASSVLALQVSELEKLVAEMHQLQGWLSVPRSVPAEPAKPAFVEGADILQRMVDERAVLVAERAATASALSRFPQITSPYTREQIEAEQQLWNDWLRWEEKVAFLKAYPEPTYTSEQIEAAETRLKMAQRDSLLRSLELHVDHCPECGAEQPGEGDHYREEIAKLGPLPDAIEGPSLTPREVDRHREILTAWHTVQGPADLELRARTEPSSKPKYIRKELNDFLTSIEKEEEKKHTALKLQQMDWMLKTVPDRSADLRTRLAYDAAAARFISEVEAYAKWKLEWEAKIQRYEGLKVATEGLSVLKVELELSRTYERELARHETLVIAHQKKLAEIQVVKETEAQWRGAKSGLDDLRTRIKSYLIPSLSRVAGLFLSRMSNGRFSEIHISDEFDLLINGQPDRTLSGSERAITNIALRIALGQILTCRVFSFLALDEPDSSMDDERAEATAETIRSLAKHVDQLLLVSHKSPEADSYIRL